ncbi:hypothetical protein [Vulcanococcus limneticus]|uniref:hypothetical protein n=1 Tax=Vulcanococcus limneticus TaxID=2170428 RepID=UPI000B995ADD|nr:hypothetical protein [Vulcanococcus limneticus]MCP9790342.1 hypothetical protein [Vulcanococcus limneticus MW73D5]MCP9892437.1 hypothetical protein [Vulcanococcus limneticus Candia 3F8]MCP9895741.1 hypothetical protein [Vulcanococcus limneticus Candia 3B3]
MACVMVPVDPANRLVVTDLAALAEALGQDDRAAGACEAVADWLMGLGHAAQAARWRSWSLLRPAEAQWRAGLVELEALLDAPRRGAELADPLATRDRLAARAHAAGLPAQLCRSVAVLEEEHGDPWEAERWYRASLRAQRAQPLVWLLLARLLLQQGWTDEALLAVETGLQLAPGHPWGLKLRGHALLATRAWVSLAELERCGALPAELDLPGERHRRQPRPLWPGPAPSPLPLPLLLALRRDLLRRPALWLLLHSRRAAPCVWAAEQELLPPDLLIQPIASRDPLAVRQALGTMPCRCQPEETSGLLYDLPAPVGLVVVERPLGRGLHRALGLLRQQPAPPPMVAPVGLLAAGEGAGAYRERLRHAGWCLWWPVQEHG